jgi:archaemetzincin
MKYVLAILSILLVAVFAVRHISCNHSNNSMAIVQKPITIFIQPFKGISAEETNYVFASLKKYFPNVQIKEPIPLPAFAYYPARNRYRADSLIRYLSKLTADGYISIGLTDKDISTNKDKISDWGVMGLGYCPGKSCIASSFRLAKKDKLMQLFKVSIHEFGHTQGLPHCAVPSCFMRDAEGKNPTNEETEFCSKCKAFLVVRNVFL